MTWKLVLTIADHLGLDIQLADVTSAFLNSDLKEDEHLFFRLPTGPRWAPGTPPDMQVENSPFEIVCVATRAMNGSPASPRAWQNRLESFFKSQTNFTFAPSKVDPCLWIGEPKENGERFSILVLVWVDDLLIVSWKTPYMDQFIDSLKKEFPITVSDIDLYLSMTISRDRSTGTIDIHQNDLIRSTARGLGLEPDKTKTRSIPFDGNTKLTKDDCPKTAAEIADAKKFASLYRTGVGVAIWISGMTRPDSQHAVSQLARFVSNPGRVHWQHLQDLYRFWLGSTDITFHIDRNNDSDLVYGKPTVPDFELRAASDASWGTEDNMTHYCGWLLSWCGTVIISKAKKWPTTAISSTETEIISMS
jgi:hypothetical protein